MSTGRTAIITRTIGRPVLLERTLRSILAQTCQDWEWVVVTPDLALVQPLIEKHAAALGGRFKVLPYIQPVSGMRGLPLNHAIAHSNSEFITVLDDDDTWHPEFLERMLRPLENWPGRPPGGTVSHTQVIEESSVADGLQVLREYPLNPGLASLSLAQLSIVNQFCIHAFVYRRSALEKTGLYPEDFPVLEDWHFNLRFLRHYDIAVIPQLLSYYHQRPSTVSGTEANSLTAELDLHKFYESRLINDQLRAEWDSGLPGPGALLAAGAHIRLLQDRLHKLEGKIKTISDKTGKIDSRTQELKSKLLKS